MTYVLPFEGVALKRHYLKHCNFYENKYTIFGIQTLWLKKSYRKKKSRVEIYLPWSDPSGNSSMHPKGSPLPTLESTVFKVRKKKKALIILVKQRLLYKTQEQETRIFSDWLQGSTEGPGLKGEAGIDSPPTSAPLLSFSIQDPWARCQHGILRTHSEKSRRKGTFVKSGAVLSRCLVFSSHFPREMVFSSPASEENSEGFPELPFIQRFLSDWGGGSGGWGGFRV